MIDHLERQDKPGQSSHLNRNILARCAPSPRNGGEARKNLPKLLTLIPLSGADLRESPGEDGTHTIADETSEVGVKGLHRIEVRDANGADRRPVGS